MASVGTTKVAEKYRQYRPKYPPELFRIIMNFVRGQGTQCSNSNSKYPLAVDVGCGPGLMSTVFLAPYFDKVLGVDISESQIEQATLNNKHRNVEYSISPAESLPVEDNSVTLIQVATALHWFDHEKFYRECDRVLAPGGVIAAFCYSVFITVITERLNSDENMAYKAKTHQFVVGRYSHSEMEIPYPESLRIDDFYFSVKSTIRNFFHFYETTSLAKNFLKEPEIQGWWESCKKRLMKAYGTIKHRRSVDIQI
ncbi:hypothetical protein EB796_006063 [Bugula neritina]|uniref:Methyltransferase type 11 domain-containing protein n=1 Tax=Bugula neritina TaxID=10212 RepID=A0A7J7KBP1_BUGNE|nr:hypothetical protein EB796_006063 [Bugula neritina]